MRFLMNVSDCNIVKTVLKKAEQKPESRDIGIIEVAKERGFIEESGKVTQEGQKFLQERIVNSSLTVNDTW